MDKKFIKLKTYKTYNEDEMQQQAASFYTQMNYRRSVRDFSDKAVDRGVIENCIKTAGSAPSGANIQPWHFVAVSNPVIKKKIE